MFTEEELSLFNSPSRLPTISLTEDGLLFNTLMLLAYLIPQVQESLSLPLHVILQLTVLLSITLSQKETIVSLLELMIKSILIKQLLLRLLLTTDLEYSFT
jgi:hypothetical protein